MRLDEILQRLNDLDAAAEDISPEVWALVSDQISDKIDAIKTVDDRLKHEAARLSEAAEEFERASRVISNNRSRLMSYVAWAMEQAGAAKLPGKLWRLDLRKNPVALEIDRKPSEEDLLSSDFVLPKTTYSWDTDRIKTLLQNGGTFEGARLKQGHHARFFVRKEG